MIKDYLYLETDYACALCGQRGKENLTEHHIDGNPENNAYDNRIILCYNCHQRYEQNKGITKHDIEERKRGLIKKTLTQYGVNAIKIAVRDNSSCVIAQPFLLYHLVDLGFMEQEREAEMVHNDQEVLTEFFINDKGRRLYNKWLKD
ncbi:HNH endonuclease [candidate division WOR-3 bacterium]|nr:HNH endonuclease [candidate division WOR-3 bacterium]